MKRRAHGFTLFEFAISASLFALLAGGLLSKLVEYQAQAEQVAVQRLVASVRTALSVRAAQALGEGGEQGLDALAAQNPLSWLLRVPGNYQGEYYRPPVQLLKPGYWHFDKSDKTVSYVPSRDTFSSGTSKLLKFKVKLLREPAPVRSDDGTEATPRLVFDQVNRSSADNHN